MYAMCGVKQGSSSTVHSLVLAAVRPIFGTHLSINLQDAF